MGDQSLRCRQNLAWVGDLSLGCRQNLDPGEGRVGPVLEMDCCYFGEGVVGPVLEMDCCYSVAGAALDCCYFRL